MYSSCNQIITKFLRLVGKLRLEEETENPFCELGLKCRVFQLEGKSDFDTSVLWALCILVGCVVCGDAPSARHGHAPRMGFHPAARSPYPWISSSPAGWCSDFPGFLGQLERVAGSF